MPRIFNRVLRLDRWSRERFTPLGRMLFAALIGVGLFALNPRATLAYQLAIVIASVLIASLLWAPLFRPRLHAMRRLPRYATVGSPLTYTLELALTGGGAVDGLVVWDEPRRVAPAAAVNAAREDMPRRFRWLPPRVGYMRFMRAMRRLEGARCLFAETSLPPGRTASVPMEFVPLRRGPLHLDALRVTRTDPLGIFRAARQLPVRDRILVLPTRYPVKWNGDGLTQAQAHSGSSRARRAGTGSDFARLREYRPRDPLRHIHWRAWARLGEPIVKEFHEESPSRNALVLDTAAPPQCTRAVFEEAVCVAASFVAEPGWRSGRLDLLFAGDDAVHLSQGSEGEGVARMLEALAGVEPQREADFATLARSVLEAGTGFGACIFVALAMDQARMDMVRALEANRVNVLVLHVGVTAPGPRHDLRARVLHVAPGEAARVLATLPDQLAGRRHG